MKKTFTAAAKEILLLSRDRAGLIILFLMPAILVVVITLVQENVMELTGQTKTKILFLNLDDDDLGHALQIQLSTGNLEIIAWDRDKGKNTEDLQAAVQGGAYQVGIVLPEGSSAGFQARARQRVRKGGGQGQKQKKTSLSAIQVFFDPAIMAGLRSGIMAQLQMAVQAVSVQTEIRLLEEILNDAMAELKISREFSPLPVPGLAAALDSPLLTIEEGGKSDSRKEEYNPVQQNVPSWALFGMFFTAIPIAGSILQERKSGIWTRLTSLPVSPLVLFAGKILAYIGVCLCQFLLIGLIGAFLFPYLGLPSFTIGANPVGTGIVVLFASLAACGYGMVLGMACDTYEQASTIGATTIVGAAAIGGVMVPVYAMPRVMQDISIISPLNWGLTAFHDLLIRGASLSGIFDDLGRLIIFFLFTMIISWKLAKNRL